MSQFVKLLFVFSGILLFAGAIYFNLVITNKKLLNRKYINHSKQWKTKAISCLPSIICFSVPIWQHSWWWPALASDMMVIAWFWFAFDGCFGWKVARDIFFTGSEDGKADAMTDNILQSIPRWLQIFLKLFLCFITVYIYSTFFD